MSKTAIVKREEFPVAPSFATLEGDSRSLAAMEQKKLTPFLKVIQSQKTEAYEDFDPGTLVLMPDKIEVPTPLVGIPLFFRPSWQKRRDRKDKSGGNNPVVEQTFVETHDIARRARSRDSWEEAYPNDPNMKFKYCEALNFVFWLPGYNTVAGYSFLIGSHKEGARLCSHLARMRTADGGRVAPHANRLEFGVTKTTNPNNESYYVLTFRAAIPPFVDPALFAELTPIAAELEGQFEFVNIESE